MSRRDEEGWEEAWMRSTRKKTREEKREAVQRELRVGRASGGELDGPLLTLASSAQTATTSCGPHALDEARAAYSSWPQSRVDGRPERRDRTCTIQPGGQEEERDGDELDTSATITAKHAGNGCEEPTDLHDRRVMLQAVGLAEKEAGLDLCDDG